MNGCHHRKGDLTEQGGRKVIEAPSLSESPRRAPWFDRDDGQFHPAFLVLSRSFVLLTTPFLKVMTRADLRFVICSGLRNVKLQKQRKERREREREDIYHHPPS